MIPVIPIATDAPDLLGRLEATWEAGAAVLPLPPGAGSPTLTAPDGTALVVRTSGSTGRPRHVALAHRALDAAVAASLARLGCTPGDRWALALPSHHVAGLLVRMRARALGTAAIEVERPGDPEALSAVEVDHIAIVPTQLVRSLQAQVDLTRFRTVLVGGGPLAAATREEARARGVRVITSYGATETCGGCVYDGVPLDGIRLRIDAAGEVLVGGQTLATGYLDDPEAQTSRFRDGWFATGDAGRLHAGVLEVLGRRDDVAVSGGVNVPLAAVTAAVAAGDGVADAIAIAVPDAEWGVIVRAVVVARPGPPPRLQDLRDRVASALPRAHAPRELLLVADLRRDGLGKVSAAVRAELVAAEPTERLQ